MNQNSFNLKANRGGIQNYSGIFNTNGASAITNEANTARCMSVARTGTGKITVTFNTWHQAVYGYNCQLNLAAPNGSFAQIDSVTLNSSGYTVMVIGTYTSAYAAADTTGVVTWDIYLRR